MLFIQGIEQAQVGHRIGDQLGMLSKLCRRRRSLVVRWNLSGPRYSGPTMHEAQLTPLRRWPGKGITPKRRNGHSHWAHGSIQGTLEIKNGDVTWLDSPHKRRRLSCQFEPHTSHHKKKAQESSTKQNKRCFEELCFRHERKK